MPPKKKSANSDDYNTWTVLELRDTLKSNGLSTEGNKKQLVARLKAAPVKEYSEYSVVELRNLLSEHGLSTKGNKKDLIKRLEDYDENGTDSEQQEESEEEEEEEEESEEKKSKKKKKNSITGTKRKSNGRETSKSPARKKAKSALKFEEENIYCDDDIPATGEFEDSDDFPKSIVCLAENGRSKCKSCRANIRKDSVRVGTQHKGKDSEDPETRWFHVRCLQVPKKITKPSDIKNYSSCNSDLQDLIAAQFKKTKISPIPASPKKTKKNTKSAETTARKKKFREACATLGNLTVAELKSILRANNQRVNANKEQLQLMVGEGMLNGALPKCSKCGGGYLHFNNSFDQLSCAGYKDDDKFVNCSNTVDPKSVKRDTWVKVDLAKKEDDDEE